MSKQSWWCEPQFSGFWNRYQAASEWVNIHRQAVNAAKCTVCLDNRSQNKTDGEETVKCGFDEVIYCAGDINESSTEDEDYDQDGHLRDCGDQGERGDNWHSEMEEEWIVENNDDGEMDEDLAEFLRQSAEHRKRRDAERLEKEQTKKKDGYWMDIHEEDFIPAEKLGIEGGSNRTTETPNVALKEREKREQRSRLYGADANKITAMEMAMQIRYEQYLSNTDAQLWPAMPIRI